MYVSMYVSMGCSTVIMASNSTQIMVEEELVGFNSSRIEVNRGIFISRINMRVVTAQAIVVINTLQINKKVTAKAIVAINTLQIKKLESNSLKPVLESHAHLIVLLKKGGKRDQIL